MARPRLLAAILLSACAGGGADPDGDHVDVMSDVLAALPSFSPSAPTARTFAPGDVVDDGLIVQRFGLECHWDDENPGACPPGVPVDLSTKYSSDRLLGLIAHAEMFTNDIFGRAGASACAASPTWAPRTVGLGSFVSDDAGADPTRFLVDDLGRLGCATTGTDGRVKAWSVSDGTRYESLTFGKGEVPSEGTDQSFLTQVVMLLDGNGKARVVATNTAGVTLHGGGVSAMRATVVANLATRRFLVRTGGGPTGGMSAAGQGGLSVQGVRSSGVWYAVSAETLDGVCVDNPTLKAVDPTLCAVESSAWAEGTTPADYLGLAAADAVLLDAWFDAWADGPATTRLTAAEAPSTEADRADLPDRLE